MLVSIDLSKMLTCLHYFDFITGAKRCPKDVKCGAHSTCMVDPLFPKTPTCKCDAGYRKNTKGKCVGELIKEKNKRERGNIQLGNPIGDPFPPTPPPIIPIIPLTTPLLLCVSHEQTKRLLGRVPCQTERV